MVGVVRQVILDSRIHGEGLCVDVEFPGLSLEYLFPIDEHLFTTEQPVIIFVISILYGLATEHKGIVELDLEGLIAGIREIDIIVRLLPFLRQVVNNVEYRKSKIGFARAIRSIDDTILNDIILNGISAEVVVTMSSQVPLDTICETPEIFYGKLCQHKSKVLIFSANIIKESEYP